MGHYLGKAKFELVRASYYVRLSIFAHGLYDWLIVTSQSYLIGVMIALMMFLWIRSLQKVKQVQQYAP